MFKIIKRVSVYVHTYILDQHNINMYMYSLRIYEILTRNAYKILSRAYEMIMSYVRDVYETGNTRQEI